MRTHSPRLRHSATAVATVEPVRGSPISTATTTASLDLLLTLAPPATSATHELAMGRTRPIGLTTRRCCLLATLVFACSRPASLVSGFVIGGPLTLGQGLALAAAGARQAPRTRGVRRKRAPNVREGPSMAASGGRRRPSPFVGEAPSASATQDWRDLSIAEERALCEQIIETRRIQDLQLQLEESERRPVTVQQWAVAAGHPSAHQLMAALQEGRKAERTILLCHQGLVRSVAFRYKNISRSLSLDDLTQEGSVGLLQAVNKFDPTKGTRFSSYAVFRIKASILRAIADKDRLVRVPVHAQDSAIRILATSHSLQLETGLLPTDAQLALALSMPEESVRLYRRSALPANVENLDDPTLTDSVSGVEGRISGEHWPWDASKLAQAQVVRRDMRRVMQACLSPTEERALRLRFGLDDGARGEPAGALTFKEIGRTMEVSAEGIRQMVFRAIAKLQESDEANGLLLAYVDWI